MAFFKDIANIVALVSVAVSAVTCAPKEVQGIEASPFVEQVINDLSHPARKTLSAFDAGNEKGGIAVFDEEKRCLQLSGLLISQDYFDNIDGAKVQDFLPDYAGETVLSIIPSGLSFEGMDKDAFGDFAAKLILAAMQPECSDDKFDLSHHSKKIPAKIVVIGSTTVGSFGIDDAQSLLDALGCDFPIISAVRSSIAQVFESQKAPFAIGVISENDSLCVKAYHNEFARAARMASDNGSRCFVTSVSDADGAKDTEPLFQFLDSYLDSGVSTPLNALIIDNSSINISSLEASLELIRTEPTAQNAVYRKLLAKDFRFIDAMESAAVQCYRTLRARNAFTHNIAYPKSEVYLMAEPDSLLLKSAQITVENYVQN